jgi:hypothetical protein
MELQSTKIENGFPEFKSRWWAWNTHVHTIVPSQFGEVKPVECERVEIITPDDDFLELDVVDTDNKKPVVALFHGLEGSSERFYIRNLMHELEQAEISSVALNFRGCGSRLNDQPRFYHSGETSDYKTLFTWMAERFPGRAIYAVGFSLGGNALIKSLGELKEDHPVKKAVAVSPPYDLKRGSWNLQKGFNKVYEYRFLRTLAKKLELKRIRFPELPKFSGNSIYDFDDQVTAKIHGFGTADNYYDTCSSRLFLKEVRKPLLIIHSKKDTLTPLEYAPFEDIETNPNITSIFTNEGGHVGFLSSPENWLNNSIIHWLETPNDLYLRDV